MSYTFTGDRAKYEAAKGGLAYVPALALPDEIKPLSAELEALADSIERVNILLPFGAYRDLSRSRASLRSLRPRYDEALAMCHKNVAEPVEGMPAADNAWLQAWSSARGLGALTRLTMAFTSVNEALDRKAAYSLACFSLYISVVSLTATVVFGWLSLK